MKPALLGGVSPALLWLHPESLVVSVAVFTVSIAGCGAAALSFTAIASKRLLLACNNALESTAILMLQLDGSLTNTSFKSNNYRVPRHLRALSRPGYDSPCEPREACTPSREECSSEELQCNVLQAPDAPNAACCVRYRSFPV